MRPMLHNDGSFEGFWSGLSRLAENVESGENIAVLSRDLFRLPIVADIVHVAIEPRVVLADDVESSCVVVQFVALAETNICFLNQVVKHQIFFNVLILSFGF